MVRRAVPAPRTAAMIAETFAALSDPSRVRILGALEKAPLCPCLLQKIEPMKNAALSYHLRILRSAGLVATSASSHYRVYALTKRGREVGSLLREALRTEPAPDG